MPPKRKTKLSSLNISDILHASPIPYSEGHNIPNGALTKISSGFPVLDEVLLGLHAGELIVIGGRPGMGKTALALNIATKVGICQDLPVLWFSLEMEADTCAMRVLSLLSGVSYRTLRSGTAKATEAKDFATALKTLQSKPFSIESGVKTVSRISDYALHVEKQHGQLGLIVVDYLQLIESERQSTETRATEIGDIVRKLKVLAQERKCPVIVLSQVNRAVDAREDKRPRLTDLRDSGSIEEDADVVLFVYRESIYRMKGTEQDIAEIMIAKHRNGPRGSVRLLFTEELMRFDTYVDSDES